MINMRLPVSVTFSGADQGDEQLVDGFHAAGTLEGWLAAISSVRDFPRVQFAIFASLVPPLLPIVKAPNFAINFSGPTSVGKRLRNGLRRRCGDRAMNARDRLRSARGMLHALSSSERWQYSLACR